MSSTPKVPCRDGQDIARLEPDREPSTAFKTTATSTYQTIVTREERDENPVHVILKLLLTITTSPRGLLSP